MYHCNVKRFSRSLADFKEFRKFWGLFHSILATKIMDQFDVNNDGVLGKGEINLWRNHFKIRDELNQDDYRSGSSTNTFSSKDFMDSSKLNDMAHIEWLVELCKRFLLNTFSGLAKSNHSIRTFIQNFTIFAYGPVTILTVLMAKVYKYRSIHV